jgi:hypothetical protein
MSGGAKAVARVAFCVLLLRWTAQFIAQPLRQDVIGSSFLHTISIPFHEAGHVFFAPFGDLMTSLGGSLAQVLIPVICLVAFLTTSRDLFAAAIMTWWAGENLMDVAVYIDDARTLQLVLLGGHTGAEVEGHDWEHILTLTGWLHRDHAIARSVQLAGAVLMLAALVWAVAMTIRDYKASRSGGEV